MSSTTLHTIDTGHEDMIVRLGDCITAMFLITDN